MKKCISIILVVVMLISIMTILTSCEKAECSICGDEHLVSRMEKDEVFGRTVYVCKDCVEDINKLLG